MIIFLENLKALAFLIILFSSIVYYRILKASKRERSLSISETAMYIAIPTASFTFAFIYFLLLLGT